MAYSLPGVWGKKETRSTREGTWDISIIIGNFDKTFWRTIEFINKEDDNEENESVFLQVVNDNFVKGLCYVLL